MKDWREGEKESKDEEEDERNQEGQEAFIPLKEFSG